jgi:hypothetical protein
VGKTDSVLAGNGVAGIVWTPRVCLTCWRCAETGATIDGCVEVLAVDIESIGVQHAVGRNIHSFGYRVTVVARLGSVRSSAHWRVGELSSASTGCSSVDTEGGRCSVCVLSDTAAYRPGGKVACQTLIVANWVAELKCLYSKPAVRTALIAGQGALVGPCKELRVAVFTCRATTMLTSCGLAMRPYSPILVTRHFGSEEVLIHDERCRIRYVAVNNHICTRSTCSCYLRSRRLQVCSAGTRAQSANLIRVQDDISRYKSAIITPLHLPKASTRSVGLMGNSLA